MKRIYSISSIYSVCRVAALALAVLAGLTACENDNINPYDYAGGNGNNENEGSKTTITTALAEYPVGSLVWSRDTTLLESVEIPVGTSLSTVSSELYPQIIPPHALGSFTSEVNTTGFSAVPIQ